MTRQKNPAAAICEIAPRPVPWATILISIAIAEATGALSALFSGDIAAVYRSLILPPLSPPGWLFPLVWTILFALMGLAAALIRRTPALRRQRRKALACYAAQLTVNFCWPIVFFRAQLFAAALVVIALLLILVSVTTVLFGRLERKAAYLLLPYLLWLIFACYLNLGTLLLN